MQVGNDVKCMHTNLGGHGLSGFRDIANFNFGPVNFPFAPYYAFSAIAQLVPIRCIHSLIAVSAVFSVCTTFNKAPPLAHAQ